MQTTRPITCGCVVVEDLFCRDGRGSSRKEVGNGEWDKKGEGKAFYTVMGFF
jgi:hypothetical protein